LGEALEFARRLNKALAATFADDFVVIVSLMAVTQLSDSIDSGRGRHG
jgi:hypothetical protein